MRNEKDAARLPKPPRRPEYLKGLPRDHRGLCRWLLGENGWGQRGGHEYPSSGTWLFCFDVKLRGLRLEFDRLLELYSACPHTMTLVNDAGWVAGCRNTWTTMFGETAAGTEQLAEYAIDLARTDFTGGRGFTYDASPNDEGWLMTWDGRPRDVRFAFGGRSDGWLVLTRFNVWDLRYAELGQTLESWIEHKRTTPSADGRQQVRDLADTVAELRHRLKDRNPEQEVETQAASIFFNNFCANVASRAVQLEIAARKRAEKLAFLDSFTGMAQRLTRALGPGDETVNIPRPRRRVVPCARLPEVQP